MRLVRPRATIMPLLALALIGSAACLDRPISVAEPSTKASIVITSRQTKVDSIDLLFMIDNSASMADKQRILAEAVPDLVASLVLPPCVDATGQPTGERADPSAEQGKECKAGKPEFAPVVDIHIGIVSSSMGSYGGTQCKNPALPDERDGGRLVARSLGGQPIAGIGASKFLAWLPDVAKNKEKPRLPGAPPITDLEVLKRSAVALVEGVGDQGCGLEAQLDSVYHFLNEPNPHLEMKLDERNRAQLVDLDTTLLAQRAEFLRPDSLVAVVMLTDEDDSHVNPLAAGGLGYLWEREIGLDGDPAAGRTTYRATSICATQPSSPECKSCWFPDAKNDPACKENGGFYSSAEDHINVRFHKMKARYGIDVQHPVSRYVDGFSKAKIAKRDGTGVCQNPLFAAKLPTTATGPDDAALCNLPPGKRTADSVFFAVLGGVPGELLHFDPNDPAKSALTDADWDKIVGKDEDHYARNEGIDPRMVQSTKPRNGRPPAVTQAGDNFASGELREWNTGDRDLQYACTFPLRPEQDCSVPGKCDCNNTKISTPAPLPPLCSADQKKQTHAKAYPTPRQLRVARLMGKQGIAASLCPLSLEPTVNGATNPYYGYRPAVATIVDRLKGAILQECLPQALPRDSEGKVACVAVHGLPGKGKDCATEGLATLAPEVADSLLARKRAVGDTSYDERTLCAANQIGIRAGETCKESEARGFCYVENAGDQRPLAKCSQALVFSRAGEPAKDVTTDLLCIRQDKATEEANR